MTTLLAAASGWPGVDEHVVLPFAEAAGRTPHPPLIPLEGDVLLFAFLCAGLVGGFFLGYLYRSLFVETGERA
jgi:cobalt/nickel transport protein